MRNAAAEAVRVRPLAREDRAAWEPLWAGYNDFYERSLPPEVIETGWARFFDPAEPVHAALAERGGRVVGLVHYLFHRSTSAIEPVCYLQDLFTDPAERGRGVGRALIYHVYDAARAAGSSRVYWHTQDRNFTAMKLYDRVADRSGLVRYCREMGAPSP
jgi:GNAT superfamily N-acetyltransferase